MEAKLRLAILISGGGTTATAIIKACISGKLKIKPALVIASRAGIKGIERIQDTGFPRDRIVILDPRTFKRSEDFADRLIDECNKYKIDIVGQYGWLPLTPKKFIKIYQGKIINQHPGPLDPPRVDFGGKGMYGRRVHCAILYFRRMTGHDYWTESTTHFVTEDFDKGEVIKRTTIKILPGDTVEDLQQRVLPIEYRTQIEVLKDFADGTVQIIKRPKLLVKDNELEFLKQAKKIAAILYPKG